MKRLISMTLILCLLLALTACSGIADQNQTTAPTVAQENPEPEVDGSITALKVNDFTITGSELTYFYSDAITSWLNQYGSYASLFGLDLTKALDKQIYDQESNKTWADYFIDMSMDSLKATYALYGDAVEAGFPLPESEQKQLDGLEKNMQDYVNQNGLNSIDDLLENMYGPAATFESYYHYVDVCLTAGSYYTAKEESLMESYTPEVLDAYIGDKGYAYSSYSFVSIYLALDNFKIGGVKNENGQMSYTAEQEQAAVDYLKEVVAELAVSDNNTPVKLNVAIALMEDELAAAKGEATPTTHTTVTENTNLLYSKVNSVMQEWLRSADRVSGDIEAIPYETTTTNENGTEVKTLRGYYILIFQDVNNNNYALANVRHILAAFEGGTTNSTTGQKEYSEAEKAQAKEKAEKLLEQWTQGEATEESFAELANKHSADGNGTTGGLYENVYPGQMVVNFNDWCFDDRREVGDTGIVESVYGYHVMYYVGDSAQTYRNYMASNDKLSEDLSAWQTELGKKITVETVDTSILDTGLILANG